MKLVFLGAPGAGKGTLATVIGRRHDIPQVSTGDIFRAAVEEDTELGRHVRGIMERGELVPDELTVELVRERLSQRDTGRGFILDGFPRTIAQADALSGFQEIDAVINFDIDDELVMRRLTGRRVCRSCGAIYNVEDRPPRVQGVCDRCGGELYVREDDKPEAVRKRLEVYKRQTEPLIAYYREKALLRDIDSSKSVEHSARQIEAILGSPG